MKYAIILTASLASIGLAGCTGADQATSGGVNANLSRAAATPAGGQTPGVSGGSSGSAIAPAHRGGGAAAASSAAEKPPVATPELDAKVEKAESKARANGASEADKLAAAAAYVERGNFYRDAGQPTLYKFALGDYRRALRYQPKNEEARAKSEEIVMIYQQMGRPVPDNGNEQ